MISSSHWPEFADLLTAFANAVLASKCPDCESRERHLQLAERYLASYRSKSERNSEERFTHESEVSG